MKYPASVILLTLLASGISAQNPTFPTADAQWHTEHLSSYCTGGSSFTHKWTEFLEGDTIVDGHQYAKLMLEPHCISYNGGSSQCSSYVNLSTLGIIPVGGVREDSGRVFFKKFDVPDSLFISYERALKYLNPGAEILIYDINWEVGDSVVYPIDDDSTLVFRVEFIEVVNGKKSFRLDLDNYPGWHDIIVKEGIGGTGGLFHMYYSDYLGLFYLATPVCAVQNNIIVQAGSCAMFCFLVGINEPKANTIKFYPNPAHGQFYLDGAVGDAKYQVRIYNNVGQLLYSDAEFYGNEPLRTDVSGLTGWLFVTLTDINGNISAGKVLVY